jgi:hypothetical protein
MSDTGGYMNDTESDMSDTVGDMSDELSIQKIQEGKSIRRPRRISPDDRRKIIKAWHTIRAIDYINKVIDDNDLCSYYKNSNNRWVKYKDDYKVSRANLMGQACIFGINRLAAEIKRDLKIAKNEEEKLAILKLKEEQQKII